MTAKLKRMQTILIIAALLIFVADISLFISTLISSDIIKILIGAIIPTALLLLSFKIENGLKLEKCSLIIYNISMATYMASFAGGLNIILAGKTHIILLGGYFSVLLPISLFGILLCAISYYLQKKNVFIKIGYVLSLLAIGTTIYGFVYPMSTRGALATTLEEYSISAYENAFIVSMVAISTIVLLSNIFAKKEYNTFFSIINLIVAFMSICSSGILTTGLSLMLLNTITLVLNIRREDKKIFDYMAFIGILVCIIRTNVFLYDTINNLGVSILIILAIIAIIDMLFSILNVGNDLKQAMGFKLVLDIMTICYMFEAIGDNTQIIPVVILVLFSSLISTYALKSDKYEHFMLPFKIVISVIGLLTVLSDYLSVSIIIYILIVNIVSVLGSMLSKSKLFKVLFTISTIISIIACSIAIEIPFDYIVALIMFILDYYLLFKADNSIQVMEPIFYCIMSLVIVARIEIFQIEELYLILGVIYALLHVINGRKSTKNISWVMTIICANVFLGTILDESELLNVSLVLFNFVLFEYLIYFNKGKDISTLLLMIALGLITLAGDSIATAIVYLIELFIILFMSYNSSQFLFRSNVILLILTILAILVKLNSVPTFVYMLIIGSLVIYLIYTSIKKYLNNEYKKEIESKTSNKDFNKVLEDNKDYIYCGSCGTRLPKEAKFCNECGNKLSK